MAETASTIPLAQAGPITDELLNEIARHAEQAQHGECTHEGGTLLIMCAAPLLRELQQRRRVMAHIAQTAVDFQNVHFLPGAQT